MSVGSNFVSPPHTSGAALLILGAIVSPIAWYRSFRLERQYELSAIILRVWLRGQLRSGGLALATGAAAAELVVWTTRWPRIWWALAAAALCGGDGIGKKQVRC